MRNALRVVLIALVWSSVAMTVVGFFLPWASITVNPQLTHGVSLQELAQKVSKKAGRVVVQVQRGGQTMTASLPDLATIPTRVSGAQILQLGNRQDVQVVLALAEMLTGQRKLGARRYAVLLLPCLALAAGIMMTVVRRARLAGVCVGLLCVAVAGIGFWKLCTTNTRTLLVAIALGPGLWLSLWAYVVLGLAALGIAGLAHPPRSSP